MKRPATTKRLYTTAEAAAALGLTDRRIRQLCESGEIDAVKQPVAIQLSWMVTQRGLESEIAKRKKRT